MRETYWSEGLRIKLDDILDPMQHNGHVRAWRWYTFMRSKGKLNGKWWKD